MASVAGSVTFARDLPTQLRGPSANGNQRRGAVVSAQTTHLCITSLCPRLPGQRCLLEALLRELHAKSVQIVSSALIVSGCVAA